MHYPVEPRMHLGEQAGFYEGNFAVEGDIDELRHFSRFAYRVRTDSSRGGRSRHRSGVIFDFPNFSRDATRAIAIPAAIRAA